MPQPTSSDVHVDAILTNISVAFIQSRDNFIANRVFPSLPVEKQSDKYFVYTKGDWFRDEAAVRAPATESAGGGYTLSTSTYSCDVYAYHKDVDDQVRANADTPLAPDRDATEFITQRMLLRREIQWTSDFFTTSVWTTDKTGGTDFTKWSTYASSDPIEDVEAGKATVLASTGLLPNTLVLGYDAYRQLRNHPDIIDRVKYTSSNTVDTDTIARLLGLERVLVSRAVKNTANEGATVSMSSIAGKNALLCYVAPSAGILTPTAGYSFEWRGVSDGLGQTIGISRFRMPELRADRIESQQAWDNKVISADLGYFFASCVA
tara:strand:- start:53 stop:1012 length:960 start_codon:yes stop_codon:yes gene_type:complete